MVNPFAVTFADPVKGSLEVERSLSDLATIRQAREEGALRQQEAGLRLAELQANAPLREAERQRLLGQYQFGDQLTREGIDIAPAAPAAAPRAAPQAPGAAPIEGGLPSWLTRRESGGDFGAVSAATGAAGRGQFMESRLADAKRAGVVPANMTLDQFRADPTAQVRVEQWHVSDIGNFITRNQLDQYVGRTVAGIPVTPNGMLAVAHLGGSAGLKKFLETGGRYNPADANGTRLSDYMLLGARAQGVQPQAAPLMTAAPGLSPAAPQPARMPSMLSATNAGLPAGFSAAGVPMAMYAAPEDERLVGMFPGTEPISALPASGILGLPGPAAPPAASTLPPPPAFTATTPEAIAQAPVTADLAGLGITPVGRAPAGALGVPATPAPAPTAAGPAGAAGPVSAPVGLGLEYSAPAQRMQQQIAREKELLQREFASIRSLPPGEAQRTEAARLRRAYAALVDKETDVQADLAAAGVLSGQTGLANQLLANNGVSAQPRVTNGRFTGYDLIQNGSVVQSNVSPEKLAEVVRNSYNSDARRQAQERAKAQYETMLEVFKDRAKQLGVATAEIAKIEAQARTRGFSQATKIGEEELILTNPTTMEALRYSFVPVPGSKPPRKELVVEQVRANVPVQ